MSDPTYEIRMPDGSVQAMTTAEIAKKTGLRRGLIQKRLGQQGARSWDKLVMSPQEAKRRGRQAFLRGTEAIFAERAKERAAEAAHEERVRSGHPEI